MSAFLIESVEGDRPYTTKQGIDLVAYTVRFKGEQGAGIAELSQKPETAPPAQGETIDAELIPSNNPDWPARLKKVRPAEFQSDRASAARRSGPGYQRDPKESAQIVRQHSQTAAVYWLAVLQKAGKLPDPTEGQLKATVDWFDRDVQQNAGQA